MSPRSLASRAVPPRDLHRHHRHARLRAAGAGTERAPAPARTVVARLLGVVAIGLLPFGALQAQASSDAAPSSRGAAVPPSLRPPAPSATELFAGLEVTAEQRARLVAATAQARAARRTLLGERPAGSRLTKAEVAELARIATAQQAAVAAALTPAQQARLAANVRAAQGAARAWRDSVSRAAAARNGGAR